VPAPDAPLELPTREQADAEEQEIGEHPETAEAAESADEQAHSQTSTVAAPSELETPATSQPPSEAGATLPATPTSTAAPLASKPATSPTAARTTPRAPVPIVPVTPKVAVPIQKVQQPSASKSDQASAVSAAIPASKESDSSQTVVGSSPTPEEPATVATNPPAPKPALKSWADLVRTKSAPQTADKPSLSNGLVSANAIGASKNGTLAEAIRAFTVDSVSKVSFLEPRGLVNTGNMCYMNSVSA
jgi:ubiquitin carboxyl-terminal hydrolase 10